VAAVSLQRVTKTFGNVKAVDNLSLEIEDKEFVVLLGPSGCGKTTTLNMVAGLEEPTAGDILFDGKKVDRLPPDKRNISMVFQTIALYPHMNAYENIAFPLKMVKRPKTEIEERVQKVVELMRIKDLLDRKPHELSGGQRQRIALGRSIIRNPVVFLFDEPLSALDAMLRVDMRVEIKKLHERLGGTFVYVTHDQVEALTMADRIAVMDKGLLQQYGKPNDIYLRPVNMMVAQFVGSPGMNFLSGKIKQVQGTYRFEFEGISIQMSDPLQKEAQKAGEQSFTMGIRPEFVTVPDSGKEADVEGWVYVVEPIGSDLILSIHFSEDPNHFEHSLFKVRTRPGLNVKAGDRIPLKFPQEHIFLFDKTGWRIYPRREPS
jgi:multiple sugar transport system ATP-binding protein